MGIAVGTQQAQTETGDQEAPLQFHVMAAEPGIGPYHHQLRPVAPDGPGALPTEGLGQLGNKGKRAEAPPELMADATDQQQGKRHNRAPKHTIPRKRADGNEKRKEQSKPAANQ